MACGRTRFCPQLRGMDAGTMEELVDAYYHCGDGARTPQEILRAWRSGDGAAPAASAPAAQGAAAPCHLCCSSHHG